MSQAPVPRRRKTKADPATPAMPQAVAETSPSTEGSADAQQKAKAGTKRKRGKNGDEDAPKAKVQRRSKIVSCEGCRVRKSKCDHLRPGCSQCKLTGHECEYSKDAQPVPGLLAVLAQGGKSLPELTARMRGLLQEFEVALANSTIQTKDDKAPITTSFVTTANGFFAGPTAIASYASGSAISQTSTGMDVDPSSSGGYDTPQIALDPSYDELVDPDRITSAVNWYSDKVVQEFRFATPDVLERLCRRDPQSPLLFFACAVSYLHFPDSKAIASVYFDLAQNLSRRRKLLGVKADIDTLEAMLLQAQYVFTTRGDAEKVWRLAGDCVRLAVSLGLHREARRGLHSVAEVNRRRWALHNCVLLDRWTSFISGRPSSLRNCDFNTALPDILPGDKDKYVVHCEVFKFMRILGDVMAETSSIFVMSHERAMGFDERIRTFLKELSSAASNAAGQYNTLNIYLMSHHARAMLHKPRMHLYDGCEAVQHEETEDDADDQTDQINAVSDAAKSVIIEAGNVPTAGLEGRLPWAPHIIESAARLLAQHDAETATHLLLSAFHALSFWQEASIAASEQKTVAGLMLQVGASVPKPEPPPPTVPDITLAGLLALDNGEGSFMGRGFFDVPELMPNSVDPSLLFNSAAVQ